MAKIIFVDKRNPRRKKWEHFKLRFRSTIFKLSILTNISVGIYFLHQQYGVLTNIIEIVTPIMESILTKLPL